MSFVRHLPKDGQKCGQYMYMQEGYYVHNVRYF